MTSDTTSVPELDFVFHPRSVAIAGISARDDARRGGSFATQLQEIGFRGPIYLLHPTAEAIRGLTCYKSLMDIPADVDYVISSIPARGVPALLEDCIKKNVKVLHMYTAGFTETGDASRAEAEQALIRRANETGIRLIGPNCMGLYVPSARLAMMGGQPPEPGPIGMVSQSGVNAGEIVRAGLPRGLRFSKVVSFGNGADLKAADFIDYFADDPETEVIAAYLEGIQDGPRLAHAIRRAAAVKPMAILKSGRTEAGARAASSHTASLAGSLAVFDGLCRQAGAVRVESMDELADMVVTFRFVKRIPGPNLAVVGGGGGTSVLAADVLAAAGLKIPVLPAEAQERLAKVTREAGTSIRNPVDTTSLWDDSGFEPTLAACAEASNIDAVLCHMPEPNARGGAREADLRMQRQIDTVCKVQEQSGRPIILALQTPASRDELVANLEFQERCWRRDLATFPSVARAGLSLSRLLAWQAQHEA